MHVQTIPVRAHRRMVLGSRGEARCRPGLYLKGGFKLAEPKLIGIPFPDEVFSSESPQTEFIIDPAQIDFSAIAPDVPKDDIDTALIYIRNTNLNIPIKFEHLSREKRFEWLVKYLHSPLVDLYIQELAETIFALLFGEANDGVFKSILKSPLEQLVFEDERLAIREYIASIPVQLINNMRDANIPLPKDIRKSDAVPYFVECLHGVFSHHREALDAYLAYLASPETAEVEQVLYTNLTPENYFRVFDDFYQTYMSHIYCMQAAPKGEIQDGEVQA